MEKVLYGEFENHAEITLNKPAKLNTLDEEVVQQFQKALDSFKNSSHDKCIVKANGPKAFCAGGDVVSVVEGVKSGRPYDFFFKQEYALDQRLYVTKGLIGHAHGIVMGGGLGVLMGCETKLLDPNCLLAMPEVTIGFFPDVGASYFLQKIPKSWRMFMTLTGARLSAYDFYFLGLVDGLVSINDPIESVLTDWQTLNEGNIKNHAQEKDEFNLKSIAIDRVSHFETLEQFENWALEEIKVSKSDWLKQSLETYFKGSPVSKVLTWEYFNWCEGKSIGECFEMDLKLAEIVSLHGDFAEGVRALLIDKDKNPNWRDGCISDSKKRLQEYLNPLFK